MIGERVVDGLRIGLRWLIRAALLILAVLWAVGALVAPVIDRAGATGAIAGLMLGVLFGPSRIAGVDFRQWFRDPGTPDEGGDDTATGLLRAQFHAAALLAAFLFLGLALFPSCWMPVECVLLDLGLGDPASGSWLHGLAAWIGGYLGSCHGIAGFLKLAAGATLGVVVVHALTELCWRWGLVHAYPMARPFSLTQWAPTVVRPRSERTGRRLIVCCDGTWNWPEAKRETNVVRLVRALSPDDLGTPQIIHYHQGVGTGNILDRLVGGGTGIGLSASVKACYGFLADNYRDGDEIFLFGFSRGAYVARALGGFVGAVGILQKSEMSRFSDVWNWYWQKKPRQGNLDTLAPQRRPAVDIECIGVWDTVGALGIPGSRFCRSVFAFHETQLGPRVKHAFQALAIDERRGNFQAAIWMPGPSQPGERPQVLKQVWFPGVHSNIGGGYPEHGLSDATFLWMVSQLKQHDLLSFDHGSVLQALDGTDTERYPSGKLQDSRTMMWKLIGCPVPRPVCRVSPSERIHESALERGQGPADDAYASAARQDWLAREADVIVPRDPEERVIARPPGVIPQVFVKRASICDLVLRLFSTQG